MQSATHSRLFFDENYNQVVCIVLPQHSMVNSNAMPIRHLIQDDDFQIATLARINFGETSFGSAWEMINLNGGYSPEATAFKSAADKELETIFNGLVKIWRESTGGLSSTARRFAHPTYRAILRLGSETVPLILKELQERPDWWFDALESLTRNFKNTPSECQMNTFEDAANAWIAWGKENHLIR